MRLRLLVTWLFLAAVFSTASAQTLSDIEKKYGPPVRAYPVDEHIWMTPRFDADGQLCNVVLYPKQFDRSTNYLWAVLPLREVKRVFDRLAPADIRGKKTQDYGSIFTGGSAFSAFQYENVRINFITPTGSSRFTRPGGSAARADDEEFPGPWVQTAQIVGITWLKRKCVD